MKSNTAFEKWKSKYFITKGPMFVAGVQRLISDQIFEEMYESAGEELLFLIQRMNTEHAQEMVKKAKQIEILNEEVIQLQRKCTNHEVSKLVLVEEKTELEKNHGFALNLLNFLCEYVSKSNPIRKKAIEFLDESKLNGR